MSGRPAIRAAGLFEGLGRLPPRAQAFVDQEERRADRLAAALALCVGLFIGLLYALTPKAIDGLTSFKPVPLFVMAFTALAAVRLVWASLAHLPAIAVYLGIAADFALFYALIWSFHLQYDEPPAFYLKAPSLLYVFILIALRALRFDVGSLVFAGFCACFGWALLTLYAIGGTPEPAITRDFQTYLTRNVVLIGAEIDKIVAMATFTVILALVIARGRRQLVAAAFGRSASTDLARFLPQDVAAAVVSGEEAPQPGVSETRLGSVLVADIRGFSEFAASVGPGEATRTLVEFEGRLLAAVEAHRGVIDKFVGDGAIATFGCARTSERHAAEALDCAVAIVDEADAWARERAAVGRRPLRVDVAVATGIVAYGVVGSGDRLEITVIGEPVNLAAKLEKETRAAKARILMDDATMRAARAQGAAQLARFEAAGERLLPNLATPVAIWAAPAAEG